MDGINKLIGNVIGSAAPGTAEFLLDVASGLSIPYFAGAEKAREEHQTDPVIGGLVEAAKTGTLALLFRQIQPFNRYIQATMMGATFGIQDAIEAPKGKKLEAFGQGVGTGLGLGLAQPSGGLGLKDIYPEVGPKTEPNVGAPTIESEETSPETTSPPQPKTGEAPETPKETPTEPTPEKISTEEDRVTHDPDIRELTDALKNVPRGTSFKDRMDLADTLKKTYTGVLGKAQTATAALKATGEAAWDFYNKPPQWTNFDDMFGQFLGARQKTGIEIERFGKQILDSMPDREQRAVTRYMQANGDEAVLQDWADRTTDPEVKQKYEDALRLPEETKNFAKSVQKLLGRKIRRHDPSRRSGRRHRKLRHPDMEEGQRQHSGAGSSLRRLLGKVEQESLICKEENFRELLRGRAGGIYSKG